MKLAFYVSNKGTRLIKTLKKLDGEKSQLLQDINFVLIDNDKNQKLKELCKYLKIDLIEKNLNMIEKNKISDFISKLLLELLKKRKIDYLFIFCDKVLRGKLLGDYKNRIINFHPSLLPSFKGLSAIDRALAEHSFLLGNTAHFVDKTVDGGPIIMQSLIHESKFKDYDSLLNMQIEMLTQLMHWFKEKRITVKSRKVYVKNGKYKIDEFIPNLEI